MMLYHVFQNAIVFVACVLLGQSMVCGRPPTLPQVIPSDWLSPLDHPRVFCTKEQFTAVKEWASRSEWHREYFAGQKKVADQFIALSDDELRSLVPPPGSLFNIGLKMHADPVYEAPLRWAGWDNPHSVRDKDGTLYPNEQYQDTGPGYTAPDTGRTYYFRAVANGGIARSLENSVLPALANAWCITGDERYAHAAAILMDAVAAVYPSSRSGPMDYPVIEADRDRGGRMAYAYYQAAIGLMGYSYTLDLIASSGHLDHPSSYKNGRTVREHIIENILWDGALFCYDHASRGYQLHNGQLDYLRGTAIVGTLLNVPELADPFLRQSASYAKMVENNIDGDGFYFESSSTYANHSRGMYLESADLIQAMRRLGWDNVSDPYQDNSFVKYLSDSFNRAEVGGHVPMTGDAGPDRAVVDPTRRFPVAPRNYNDTFLDSQLLGLWVLLVEGENHDSTARLLRTIYGDNPIIPPANRWSFFNISPELIAMVAGHEADPATLETSSAFYGLKGHALLRGGTGSVRHGAQLLFGGTRNHGHREALTWTFFAHGAEWSMDPGYYNTHFRFGFTSQSVAHQAIVVDHTSIDPASGTGHLLSWHDDSSVQWAMASHPGVYKQQGVTCYERLIAQVQTEDAREIGYWLDIGRVAGGATRDDSFHSRMAEAEYSIALPSTDPARVALAGAIDLGRQILADSSLRPYQDKPFYWAPDGDGYGFLGNPREIAMPASVRAVMRNPFAADQNPSIANMVMTVDLAGGTGRKLIVADGPEHPTFGLPAQPYILSRDEGSGTSTFAKVIRVTAGTEEDPIESFEQLEAEGSAGQGSVEPSAWCVTWKDGRRDVWIVADATNTVAVSGGALPTIETDGRVTMVRFGADGKVLRVTATEASHIAVDGGPVLSGQAVATGTIFRMDPVASPAAFDVQWRQSPNEPTALAEGALVRVATANGQPTSWTLHNLHGNHVTLVSAKVSIGSTRLQPSRGYVRRYELLTSISQLLTIGNESNTPYALGRSVYVDGKRIGRIVNLLDQGKQIEIQPDPGVTLPVEAVESVILAMGEGDEVTLPITLHWSAGDAQAGADR